MSCRVLRGKAIAGVVAALMACCVLLVGCGSDASKGAESVRAGVASAAGAKTTINGVAITMCEVAQLPSQGRDTIRLIHSGGPFPYPRNDGVVFGNREGHLPKQTSGYYHEYTVKTPGASNRGTRRIITGGGSLRDPQYYYYTADHYDSFCAVTDADRLGS